MRRSLRYKAPKWDASGGYDAADQLADQVRVVGERTGVKIPKSINLLGMYSSNFFIPYISNKMRDIIIEVANEMGLVQLVYENDTDKWVELILN